jgi:uncharacterized membrane protein YedE/YeeE
MSAPFYVQGAFSDAAALAIAVLIGIGFGFFLERAGFGSARKLVAQFYLTDLAVFKVMFSAIVTALLGTGLLAWLGFLDLSLIPLVPTFWVAQLAGGLLLGVGFVVGGYCPGTSVAAAATGKIDGVFFMLGMAAGTLLFALAFPALRGLYLAGALGEKTLPETLSLPRTAVTLAVLLIALAGFWAAGRIEKAMAAKAAASGG